MKKLLVILLLIVGWAGASPAPASEPLSHQTIADLVVPPFSVGEPVNDKGVWQLLNSGGAQAGYVFETQILAPLPGFSGAAINMLVTLDNEGRFIEVRLLEHNEPIFVSGLGEAPFHKFFEQYRGLAISQPMVVGTPYGDAAGGLTYLNGVTKATASVRIAHESILAATLAVAREKMQGVSTAPPARPDPTYEEALTWQSLLDQGLVGRLIVTNAEVDALFQGTLWEDDDDIARDDPAGIYADLYVIDLGPPSIARAVLDPDGVRELQNFKSISTEDEPLLLIEAGRHGLVSDEFVRNTAPDLVRLSQDGLPVALRDADLFISLNPGLPDTLHDANALILRTDRRLGFDPSRDWALSLRAERAHGIFKPEIGSVDLTLTHHTDPRFFVIETPPKPVPPWLEALRGRASDLWILAAGLILFGGVALFAQSRLAGHRHFALIRLTLLGIMLGFVGWYGQGQLSIVTVMATLRTVVEGGSFAFLIYDPFSLMVWAAAILGFALWGRGFFCGWLCPFGALQEFADRLGRFLRLPQFDLPAHWDARFRYLKYVLLFGMLASVFIVPSAVDSVAELEPFKTAITVYFIREWYFAAYAIFWLVLGLFMFKGFCRYVCPLGAFMALGGLLRLRKWIPRRDECGSPCQLCKVRCRYGAIEKTGKVQYSECFHCLDCVTIHDDPGTCVPLVLQRKKQGKTA